VQQNQTLTPEHTLHSTQIAETAPEMRISQDITSHGVQFTVLETNSALHLGECQPQSNLQTYTVHLDTTQLLQATRFQ